MRVAFYAPMKPPSDPVPSGDRRMARLLAQALERGGFTVELASRFRSYDRGDPARQDRLAAIGARLAERTISRLMKAPPALRPDLWFTYHLYHKAPDHLGPRIAQALGIPYVVAEASYAPKQASGRFAPGHAAAAAAIARAERIYSLNPVDAACLRPLVRNAGVLAELPPFLETSVFRRSEAERTAARAALAARHGLDPGVPVILTVAMMRADQKLASYAVLCEALASLADRPWQWLVAGAGPAEAEVRRRAAPFGPRAVVAGLADGADLAELYAGSDLFAWPAVKEAFGMAFLEAAASGLPVVAGRSGGIGHIVEDGATGFVVPAGDAGATARALRRLLDDPGLARRMGRAGSARAAAVNDIAAAAAFLRADLVGLVAGRRSA